MPTLGQLFIAQNQVHYSGTVDWWVGVHWSRKLLQPTIYDGGFFITGC